MKAHMWEHIGEHTYELAQPQRTWTGHKSHFVWKFIGKMPDPNSGVQVLCELAQSTSTWTFHKNNSVWKFRGKMPHTIPRTALCASLGNRSAHDISQKTIWCGNSNEKMRGPPVNTSIEHRAPSGTVRTPQCGHAVCGKLKDRMLAKGYFQMICYNVWHISCVDTYSPFKKIAIEAGP